MKSEFVSLLKNKLNKYGIYSIGYSKREIGQLEDYANFALPDTYKEFLAHFGKGTGKYLDDINLYYDGVFKNRNSAKELLEEDESDFNLKETDFVFSSYQGGQFMYFSLIEGDDPPVYYYSEGAGVPSKTSDKFSECITDIFEDVFGKLK